MKSAFSPFLLIALCAAIATAQQNTQFIPDSLTRGLWHFNESSGQVAADSSAFGNAGTVFGTTIVPGHILPYDR